MKIKELEVNKETVMYNILALGVIIFTIICLTLVGDVQGGEVFEIDGKWKVSHNNSKEQKCRLSEYKIDMAKKDDIFVLKRKITKEEILNHDIKQAGIMIEEASVYVRAWIDDTLIFDDIDKKKYIIPLDSEYLDKEIKIEYRVVKNNAFSSLKDVHFIDEYDYAKSTLNMDYFDLILGGFILLLGLSAIMLTLFKAGEINYRIFLTGSFMLCLSGWLLANNKSYTIFSEDHALRNILKYYTLYYGVPIFGVLLSTFVCHKLRKKILNIILIVTSVVVIASTVISIIDESKILKYLTVIEVLGVIIITLCAIFIKKDYNKQVKSEKMILHAFLILAISMCYEAVRDIVVRALGLNYSASYGMRIGLIVFLLITIDAYILSAIEVLNNCVEKDELSTMAYEDVLTGLANRSKVMEEIDKIKNDNIVEYSILNFDLNDLKKINDVNGHKAGDEYLCIFSNIIKQYLGGYFDVIGRTGGDEFIAISKNYIKKEKIESIVKKISHTVLVQCKKKYDINATFAYGYAASNLKEQKNIDESYTVADEMMYECKRKMKLEMKNS